MATLILCEKPSVAQDFAKALRAEKKAGYFENSEYVITYAFGHFFEIDDSIAPEKWTLESLPIFPERFQYRLKKSAGGQYKVIKELLLKADRVLIATDAGKEGELIARLILVHAGWKNWERTYRFWTSSALTGDVILREIKRVRPAKEFDSLYWCALARQHADWLVGINLTRVVSLKSSGGVWSAGRVQTPTLTLVVERDKEVENFQPKPYRVVKALFEKGGQKYEGVLLLAQEPQGDRPDEDDDEKEEGEEEQGLSPEQAKKIVEELSSIREGLVSKVIKKRESKHAPALYSLTALQRDANKIYGFSAQKTLDTAQKLYETYKCISYPRSDAEYLAEENKPLVREVLRVLGREDLLPQVEKVGKRVFNNAKLTDHHAIIPLGVLPEGASLDEKLLYELILKRFLAVFYPPYEEEKTQVLTQVGRWSFYTQGRKVLSLGWRELYSAPQDKELPELKEKDRVGVIRVWDEQRWTKPPPRYTEGSLIKKMERLGLGTPATRAGIIETLKRRGYISLNRKHILSTAKGRELVEKLKKLESSLTSAELTGEWERKLESIYKKGLGYRGYQEFLSGIKFFVEEEIKKLIKEDFHAGAESQRRKNRTKAYQKAHKKGEGGGFGGKRRGDFKGKRKS
ncbi:MAG: DNA topoisomerase [Nitrososphaerales archaeon]